MKVYLVTEQLADPKDRVRSKPRAEIFTKLEDAYHYLSESFGFEYAIEEYDIERRVSTYLQKWKKYQGEYVNA